MIALESLPDRPLRRRDLDALEAADRIDRVYARFWTGEEDVEGDYTAQFDLFLDDGRAFAIHFETHDRSWRLAGQDQLAEGNSYGDVIERLEYDLEEARGDDKEYGLQFAKFCGLR